IDNTNYYSEDYVEWLEKRLRIHYYFNIGDEVELNVYIEICCEICGEVIHNHIDCPVCKTNYAGTDKYCDLYDEEEVTCEDCGTTFAKISDSWYSDCKAKIVSLGKNYL